jgi:hypothetical protein
MWSAEFVLYVYCELKSFRSCAVKACVGWIVVCEDIPTEPLLLSMHA